MRTFIDFIRNCFASFFAIIDSCRNMAGTEYAIHTAIAQQGAPVTQEASVSRVVSVFAELRPLLVALSVLPLIPAKGRALLTALIAAIDALALTTNPDFKAGKDV